MCAQSIDPTVHTCSHTHTHTHLDVCVCVFGCVCLHAITTHDVSHARIVVVGAAKESHARLHSLGKPIRHREPPSSPPVQRVSPLV